MKKIVYTLSAILFSTGIYAQNLVDALRYSDYKIHGTARSTAMGNAFGALGGDFTSMSINPAGLGLYRSGEFVFTPNMGKSSVDGLYLNNTSSDSRYNFSIDNIGYVSTIKPGKESSLVSLNFGIGYNRLNNYSMNMLVSGDNARNSILTGFTNRVNDDYLAPEQFDPYYEALAYDTYLMDYDEDNDEFFNDLTDQGYGQSQRKTTNRRGYINEYLFSLAANFNHQFYVGATLGIHDLYFKESTDLFEYDANNDINYFNDLNFLTDLRTSGTGFNFKLGAIYKPTNELRLGVAIHTPTFYRLHDTYENTMLSSMTFDGKTESFSARSPLGEYDYDLETPLRGIFSAAYVIGKKGLISIDYEVVDYSTTKLRDGGNHNYQFTDENNEIAEAYKSVGNLHIGGEYRLTDNFNLRAGYENYPSPFNSNAFNTNQPNSNMTYSAISAGLGIRQGNFFIDMAYKHRMNEEYNTLYSGSDFAKYDITNDHFILTLGFKF
ncbi:MAG: outer membrane protein transport protein [Prolixibacteraceae bacterium]|jgi:hypothetical protein|nr:outer membrane protein transport protein [Prolixibacteraceae bacterium]